MTNPEETSPSGAPLYRHQEGQPWQPAQGEPAMEQISAHIEQYLGPIETVFHEIASDTVHIDVHIVPPTAARPFYTLVTSGMSDLPMHTPEQADVPRYLELMLTLPAGWQLNQETVNNEQWYWPIRLLKYLARFPHHYQTWLGWGHTIPNGQPPDPLTEGTQLAGMLIFPSVLVPEPFHVLEVSPDKVIVFMAVYLLYAEELELKLNEGVEALMTRFYEANLTDLIDLTRPNVAL